MTLKLTVLVALSTALYGCVGEGDFDAAQYAIDTDGDGAIDCSDLDHLHACIDHPDSDRCAAADVNHDGVVDETDAHLIHEGLAATGHECAEPEDHEGDGDHTTDGDHVTDPGDSTVGDHTTHGDHSTDGDHTDGDGHDSGH